MSDLKSLRIVPGRPVSLSRWKPDATPGARDKDEAGARMEKTLSKLRKLQYRLYAEGRQALLIVLQGIDAAGKDGTIRHVMSGLNPQGCDVYSFKVPSDEERSHDFLWRIHRAVPPHGSVGIFNRSHYEDILVPRVKLGAPRPQWKARCGQINDFERYLVGNGISVLKFFLHISKEEQKRRLQQRLDDPSRHWKVNPADFEERKRWNDYQAAYEDMLHDCSTKWAPWHVIPADHKWYRNYAVSQFTLQALERMDPQIPEPSVDLSRIRLR